MTTKTHTITGTRKGKTFIKEVEIQYDNNQPKFIKNLFGHTGYIEYEELFDSNDNYLGDSQTPEPIVNSYRDIPLIENFKIVK
tara:strand:- start:329 stop:577 length:249 start_codon:yes stop_codon:yes gene_type:complete